MPYNTSAILPPDEVTGQATLPLTRIKRIIRVDDDVQNCANTAAFAITIATEMFIQYLAEQGMNVVKSERKPRKNIQYKDLANAVARIDNLEFLSDVIPRTIPYKQYKEKRSKETANAGSVEAGQTTLDGTNAGEGSKAAGSNEIEMSVDAEREPVHPRAKELDMEIRGPRTSAAELSHTDHSPNDNVEVRIDPVREHINALRDDVYDMPD
ncbi:MAG: hypothetical protein M4579_005451 [Chaenotheca gracillima]|nr:MAG: hypothetical protein M4579_005451 [Chaenotheca gracillima]